jgi:hypothetical protein
MSIAVRFIRRGCPPGLLFVLLSPYHIIPPLAVILAALVGVENAVASLILTGFSTGTFIYIGAYEVLVEEFAEHVHVVESKPKDDAIFGVDGTSGSSGKVSNIAPASASGNSRWHPKKWHKFLAFLIGCGIQFGLLAAAPGGGHNH